MTRNLIRTALLASAVFGSVVVPAGAQANCDWYAKTALKQQQENEQRKCNFTGNGWSSDLRSHMTWCAANPDQWKSEAQRRETQLASCKK